MLKMDISQIKYLTLSNFFQVITIDENKLTYVAYTATGKEYDRAVIVKDFESGDKKVL